MSSESVLGLFCCAIGVALVVVTFVFPVTDQHVVVKREPIYVRVQDSPWVPMPELSAGGGRPAEPR